MASPVSAGAQSAPVREAALAPGRVLSIDALRGFVMVLMLAEVMHLNGLARAFPGNPLAEFISFHTSHVPWAGVALHDLIQPGFSFLVGTALAYSVASRRRRGQPFSSMLGHAVWRAVVLIALGVILRSMGRPMTYFTFEDTLSQIGLGYVPLFLAAFLPVRAQVALLAVLLLGYWGAFAMYPAPGPAFDYASVGVPPDWPHHYSGFASHWNKNSNLAWAFDTWFLNLFPREQPFRFNGGGYATLSFIPTLGTMLLGLLAGQWLRTGRGVKEKITGMAMAGLVLLAAGALWHFSGTGPWIKRIWTPSWTLGSGGLVLLMLAGFHWMTELKQWRAWTFPFIVVGANSIAAYVMAHLFDAGLVAALNRHFGQGFWELLGPGSASPFRGAAVLLIYWAILLWMYRRNILIRI